MGSGHEGAVGGESSVPCAIVLDLLMSVLVSMDALLGQVMLAEEALTAVGDDGPYDAIFDLQVVSCQIRAWGQGSELDDLADDFVT